MGAKDQIRADWVSIVAQGAGIVRMCGSGKELGFGMAYQSWYTKALRLVSILAPDRCVEFRRFYEPDPKRKTVDVTTYAIQDYIKCFSPTRQEYDVHNLAGLRVANQLHILQALESRIDGSLANIEAAMLADLQGAELSTAEALKKVNLRAAGALAGVVLEMHLQRLAASRQVPAAKKNPTIGDLNDPLRDAGVYDLPTWRKIQHLGDIRNLCSHKKDREPTKDEVDDLIIGVRWVTGNIN